MRDKLRNKMHFIRSFMRHVILREDFLLCANLCIRLNCEIPGKNSIIRKILSAYK